MATLLIDKLYDIAAITITDNEKYDFLILPEANGIKTAGQIITIDGQSDGVGYNSNLESFCISVKGSNGNGKLSIGGNYNGHVSLTALSSWDYRNGWKYDFVSNPWTDNAIGIGAFYNLYHVQFNNADVSGAIKFHGSSNSLVLTAQNGAQNANIYHNAASGENTHKTDDNICIKADAYGVYSDNVSSVYGNSGAPGAPYKDTIAYTIYATNKLTVVSDLAGTIDTDVAALHTGYTYKSGDKTAKGNDSSSNTILGAAVKADTLVLDGNFRADILVRNNKDTLDQALLDKRLKNAPIYNPDWDDPDWDGSTSDARKVYEFVEEQENSGGSGGGGGSEESIDADDAEPDFITINGTTIAGYASPHADNNKINNYGIWTDTSLTTADNTIWGGTITVRTENVRIIASAGYLASGKAAERGVTSASANNNEISAYGIKSEGSITINEMGTLVSDDRNDGEGTIDVSASINVSLSNNRVQVKAVNQKETKASASISTMLTAAGIDAKTLTLGKVSNDVEINVTANNNVINASSGDSFSIESSGLQVYGINADTVNLTNFDGKITIKATGMDFSSPNAPKVTGAFSQFSTGINASTLTSTTNLYGDIEITSDSSAIAIKTGALKVDGVIDTDMKCNTFGIYASNITASAFTGSIDSIVGGINVTGQYKSNVSGDMFDITGNVSAYGYGVISGGPLYLRVSGSINTIEEDGFAIYADIHASTGGKFTVTEVKNDDVVEIAGSANISGNIDLGAGLNTITVDSNARIDGSIIAGAGEVNLFFNLNEDTRNDGKAAITSRGEGAHDDDKSLKDSMTFTVNCNYAAAGTYNLFAYNFDASEYWNNGRQIAFSFHGKNVMLSLDSKSLTGETTINYTTRDGKEATLELSAQFVWDGKQSVISVTIGGDIESAPELVWDYTVDTPAPLPGEEVAPAEPGNDVVEEPKNPTITETYDFEKETVTIKWDNVVAANYGLASVAAYEIEYFLYDARDNKLGESIVVRLDGSKNSFDITGVANNTRLEYRMRLLGDNSANAVSNWSDYRIIDNKPLEEGAPGISTYFDENAFEFDTDKLTSDVIDANPKANTTGVVAAIAELSWKNIGSTNPIRNYEIEYCSLTEQLTIEQVRADMEAAGEEFVSLSDYIANYMEMDYTKLVTGTQVAVSNLQNQTFVYWRIRAIDSKGNVSDWVAGETFRVWATDDKTDPIFSDTESSAAIQFNFPALEVTAPDTENKDTLYSATLGWNHATDSESGVRAYIITLTDDKGNKKVVEVNSESMESHSFAVWNDTGKALDQNCKYRVNVNGLTLDAALRIDEDGNVSLAWNSRENINGAVTIEQYIDGVWQNTGITAENVTVETFDFSAVITGLNKASYKYYITAIDYFGNEVDVTNSIQGSFDSDITKPLFDTGDVTFKENFGFSSPANLLESTTLKGSIIWNGATDAESGIRSYVIKLSTNGGKSFEKTFDFAVAELEKSCQTRITLAGFTANAVYTVNGESFTADANGDLVILTDGNIIGTNIDVTDANGAVSSVAVNHNNAAICYSIDIAQLGLTNPAYTYFIYAKDYIGNESSNYLSGDLIITDKGAPSFISNKTDVSVETKIVNDGERDVVTIKPTLSWTAAQDVAGDLGVRYYAVFVRAQGSEEWGEAVYTVAHDDKVLDYSWTAGSAYDMQVYDYKIVAYDFFGKSDTISGNFGMTDIEGPTGSFSKFNHDIVANYEEVIEVTEKPVLDEEGNPVMEDGQPKVEVTEKVVATILSDATVTLSWSDNFKDDSGVIYKVTVSADKNLSPDANTYTFWTTTAGEKYMVFSGDTTGRPVSIFEDMKTVYWTVEAYDTQYNASSDRKGDVQSFEFKNKYDKYIVLDTKLAAPTNVKVDTSDMSDGVHSGVIAVSWTDADTPLGIYKYAVNVYDEKGKTLLFTADTLDLENKLGTDIANSVSISGSTLTISDLRRFLSTVSISDGTYKLSVTGFDASGNKAESEKVEFILDTTRPSRVAVTEYFAVPDNAGDDKFCNLVIRWQAAADDYGIDHYVIQFRKKGSASWSSVKVYDATEYTLTGIPEGSDGYEFRIYAVDTQGNEGIEWPNDEVVTVKPIFDKYGDSIKSGQATDVTKSFDANGRLIVADTVGQGDTADTFCIKTTNSMALTLTADDLGISIGNNKSVKLNIYEGGSSKVWKSYTISNTGRIFSDLLLNSNTTYTFQVVNTKSDANVSSYEFVLDKTGLDSYNGDDTVALARENDHIFNIDGAFATTKNWVGYGDTADYQILDLIASGKYVFTLSDVALATKLTIYEVQANGKLKSLGSVTANQSSFNGVSTKELLLDMNKEYVMAVTPGSSKALGSSYEVNVKQTESYTAATTADDLRNNDTPEISAKTAGWVGFGDATDFHRLEVGEDGGVYNFTVSHDLGSDEALKLTIYELTAVDAEGNPKSFRSVKSITLANTAADIATGSLYLKGDKGGTYFIEVTATGAAKALNSDYVINVNGYNIADKLALPDTGADTPADAVALNGTVDGWVGMGDASDYYSFNLAEAGLYTFTLENINGNNIAVAISYVDAESGKTVKLANVTGTANANGLVLSREFTAEEVEAAGNNFIIQVSANGKTANSDYQIKLENNASISGFNHADDDRSGAPELSVGVPVSDWVGMGDATDYRKITVTESGIYDLVAGNADNPVKVTVYDAAQKKMGTLSLTAGKNSGALSGMTLIAGNDYFVEVTATGAAKGQSSSYDLVLNSQSLGALSAGETRSGKVGPADKVDSYVLTIGEAGFYTFALDNVNGNAVKFSVIDPVTGKAVANLTPAANSTAAAITYEFTAPGEYIVKLEGTSKSKDSAYDLTLIDRNGEVAMDDDGISETLPTFSSEYSGWTGLGDVIDFAKIGLVNGTGIYDITLNVADNNAKLTVYEMVDGISKAIKTVSATQAKAGALTGLMLNSGSEYFVSVQVANGKGMKDTSYTVTLEQTVKSQFDGDSAEAPVVIDGNSYVNAAGWVGFGDAADYCKFTVNGTDATDITFALGDNEGDITVTLYQISEEGSTKVKSFTVNAKNADILNSYLLDNGSYLLEVVSPKAAKGAVTDYSVSINNWKFGDYVTADNTVAKATKLSVDSTVSSAVWNTGTTKDDMVDFYQIVVESSGFYMFDLAGTSGTITFSIGTLDAKGNFKQLQKVSGKAGVADMTLARELAAGTYYIKLESSTKNSASQYELSMENNSVRVNSEGKSTFSSVDDTWKLVANDTAAVRYSNNELIENWVGFGDAVDVFKIRTDENGVLVFQGSNEATIEALLDKDITLTLADVNGKSVALTFDAALGEYVSKNILLADTNYYLQIKSADSKTGDTAFAITFNCK